MKKCEYCGKDYEPKTSRSMYCSRECNDEAHKKRMRKRYAIKHKIGEERICACCGKKFKAKSEKGKFCSTKCNWASRNGAHPIERKCEVCGNSFITSDNHPRKTCGNELCVKEYRAIYRRKHGKLKRIPKEQRVDKDITLAKLILRDGKRCWLCGELTDENDYIVNEKGIMCGNNYPSIDHIIPISKGGLDAWDNVRVAHRRCNSIKNAKN